MNQRRTLVLMPGLDGTGRLFAPLIPLLEPHFDLRVVTYPDLDSFDDYVECALRQLPAEPGYSLVAESFSSPVALTLLSKRLDIGPSVLSAGFARSPLATLTRMAVHVPDHMFSIGALNEFCLDVDAVDDEDFSETQPLPLNVTEQLDGKTLKHRISVLSRIDVSALLPAIEAPLLYLYGVRDRIVSEIEASMIESYLPRVTRIDIDGPHLLLQTRPRECVPLIVRHVMSSSQGTAAEPR